MIPRLKLLLALFAVGFSATASACAQLSLRPLADKEEVKVDINYFFKQGRTAPYSIDLKNIPNGSRLPNGYEFLTARSYDVKVDDLIEGGTTMVTFKVPINDAEDFKKIRVLHLTNWELNSSGYEWVDCTVPRIHENSSEPSDSLEGREGKFFPDFGTKRISCALDERLRPDNYFVLVRRTQQPKTEARDQIQLKLELEERAPETGQTRYVVSFKNVGERAYAEVNTYSIFEIDTTVVSYKPQKGRCQSSDFVSRSATIVCYLGPLRPGETTSLEIVGAPSGMASQVAGQPNREWTIEGIAKEHPDDSYFGVGVFGMFEPLKK